MELVRSFAPNTPAEADDRLDPGSLNIKKYNMLPQSLPDMGAYPAVESRRPLQKIQFANSVSVWMLLSTTYVEVHCRGINFLVLVT